MLRVVIVLALIATAGGCAGRKGPFTSKWANSDPVYRAKYEHPYPRGAGRIPRMAKQMVDARHVEKRGGLYAGAAVAGDPISLGGEFGLFYYPNSWVEGRVGLAGLAGAGADNDHAGQNLFAGANAGVRAQIPSRIAPFVGTGMFVGYSEYERPVAIDGIDNDGDLFIDEPNESVDDSDVLVALFPEVGVHAWLTPRWRLTSSLSYYVTTEGRDQDFWFLGLSLAWLGERRGHVRRNDVDVLWSESPSIERLPPP